ncbi:hypothetical protein CEE39_07805, partial [bacterium (candidate division B38) B3_B38]
MPEHNSKESYIKEIKNQVDNYEQTVFALLAFANHARWDEEYQTYIPESQFSIGRRMSPEKGDTVTPDLVVQRTQVYGLIVEAKKTFPKEKNYWIDTLKQLKRYDGKLKGWFTNDEFIDTSDLVLMIHYPRAPAITEYIEERCREGELSFQNNFSIVSFVIEEKLYFINLEKRYGEIYDKYINDSLKNICRFPMEKLLCEKRREIKFYDDEPPMPYLLQILWHDVFSNMKEDYPEDYPFDHERRCTPIPINVKDLTEILQKYYG